jgi:hypothetical protein
VRIANRPPREARPERVAQRAAGQREAERVVLVHHVGDEAEAGVLVEQGEGGGGQRVHCDGGSLLAGARDGARAHAACLGSAASAERI